MEMKERISAPHKLLNKSVKPKYPLFAKVVAKTTQCYTDLGAKEIPFLFMGNVYQVSGINMGRSNTDVYLTCSDLTFNSVNFDFFKDEKCEIPHDIYEDPYFNKFIKEF